MPPQTEQTYRERILQVLVHIQTHLDEPLGLEDLARLAHFSPYHFHRIFRGMVGEMAFKRSPSRVHFADGRVDDFSPLQMGGSAMEVRIEQVQPRRVAFVRHVGPYMEVSAVWQRLMAFAGPRGLLGPNMVCIGICHDDPEVTPSGKIRYDACVPVDGKFEAAGDVGVQDIAGGEYAVCTHRGPYDKLPEAYADLCGKWLPASGREPGAAPCFGIYRNSPQNTPPDQLITDIYLPLQPKG